MEKLYYSLKEVCDMVGLSYSTVNRNVINGNLKVSKITGKNLFKKEWIEEWLNPKIKLPENKNTIEDLAKAILKHPMKGGE